MRTLVAALVASALLMHGAQSVKKNAAGEYTVYIGTYTEPRTGSKGIYAYRFHPADSRLTPVGLVAETANPSFLAIHPNGQYLYAVNELDTYRGKATGAVSAFRIDLRTAKLTLLNTVSSGGGGPCHLLVDESGKNLLVANYGTGSVACLRLREDGSLGDASAFIQHQGEVFDKKRQGGPHAHSVNLPRGNRFMLATDLGLDEVLVYRFDAAAGTLAPNQPPIAKVEPGSGPRHFAFHPSEKYAYVLNEIKSTVTAFRYDAAKGSLESLQTISTLPKNFSGKDLTTAEIAVDQRGRFLYASNRGHDSIAVFAIDQTSGKLTLVEITPTQGKTPRNFAIDPTGAYLFAANEDSGTIVVFRIDQATGRLTPAGQKLVVPAPVCITFIGARTD